MSWRDLFKSASIACNPALMQDIFDAADPSTYGIFDNHYLQASIHIKGDNFKAAIVELEKIFAIRIANTVELAEHQCIADLLIIIIRGLLGESISDSIVISVFNRSPASNKRFLNGFVNGGYLGIDFVFPRLSRLIASNGTSFLDLDSSIQGFKEKVLFSIGNRLPFLFIRCNDGEGCLLYYLDALDQNMSCSFEYYYALSGLWRGWFGTDLSNAKASDLSIIKRELEAAICSSSFVGLDLSVVNSWRKSIGLESKLGCYYSVLKTLQLRGSSNLIGSSVLYDLQDQDGFTLELIRSCRFSAITCHFNATQRFKHCGISIETVINIPAEQQFNNLFGTPDESGRHLDEFLDICSRIDRINPNEHYLWIVAAGPLGKIYANKLMNKGCFVLDIGAIMDGLLGYSRRDRLKSFAPLTPL